MRLPLAVLLLLLSGCFSPPGDGAEVTGADAEAGEPRATAVYLGWGQAETAFVRNLKVVDFHVHANATAMLVELRWDNPSQLGLSLVDPEEQLHSYPEDRDTPEGILATFSSPIRATLDTPMEGPWWARSSGGATVAVCYDLVITVFYDGPVPDGFSSLPAEHLYSYDTCVETPA